MTLFMDNLELGSLIKHINLIEQNICVGLEGYVNAVVSVKIDTKI